MEYQRPSPLDQKKFVKQIEREVQYDSCKGDVYYLIEAKWYEKWKSYVDWDDRDEFGDVPEPIDNSPLLVGKELKPGLLEGQHYYLVPEKAWKVFSSWYGGGPEIARKMIEMGKSKQLMVEVYLVSLKVFRLQPGGLGASHVLSLSRKATLGQFVFTVGQIFSVPPHKARVWLVNINDENIDLELLQEDLTRAVEDLPLQPTSFFIFELQLPNGEWMKEEEIKAVLLEAESQIGGITTTTTSSQSQSREKEMEISHRPPTSRKDVQALLDRYGRNHGVCGLSNLGNTCFMNSALQCLSNTAPLTMYFLSDRYKSEINKRNPLGMEGQIALSYADLIKKMWSGKNGSVAPSSFKHVLGKFAPQFEGYRQHDSQELLAFLLDGLHEDLNRVLDKPYVPTVESNGRPDDVVAREAWESHLRRNKSIIVDYFQGQLKSTVTCPDCSKVSITFDPFMYLSLPLPTESIRQIKVTVYPYNGTPTIYAVQAPKRQGNILTLKTLLSELAHIPTERMVVADVYLNKVHALRNDTQSLEYIRDSDRTAVYELPLDEEEEEEDGGTEKESTGSWSFLSVVQRKGAGGYYGGYFGEPRVICIKPGSTSADLYAMVYKSVSYLIKKDDQSDPMDVEGKSLGEQGASFFKLQPISISTYSTLAVLQPDDTPVSKWCSGKLFIAIEWLPGVKLFEEKEITKVHSSASTVSKEGRGGVQLDQCLKLFMTQEKLGKDDEWFCPQCKELKQATKKFDLWKTPDILVVHLKRFQYNRWYRDKLDTFVDFPVAGWDLRPFLNITEEEGVPPAVYDLFAVSNHSGGLGGGHYTAYAKNFADGRWYSFNDSSTREVDGGSVVSSSAYVLFYQRRQPNSE